MLSAVMGCRFRGAGVGTSSPFGKASRGVRGLRTILRWGSGSLRQRHGPACGICDRPACGKKPRQRQRLIPRTRGTARAQDALQRSQLGEACQRASPVFPALEAPNRGVHSNPADASRCRSGGPSPVQTLGRAVLDPSGQGQGRYGNPPTFSGTNAGKPNNRLSLPQLNAAGQGFPVPSEGNAY